MYDHRYFITVEVEIKRASTYAFWWAQPGNVVKSYVDPTDHQGGCWCCPLVDDTGMRYAWFSTRQLQEIYVD